MEKDGYTIRKLTSADLDDTNTYFLGEYLQTMTLNSALNVQVDDVRDYYYGALASVLEQPYNYAAFYDGQMVACRLAMLVDRQSNINQRVYGAPAPTPKARELQKIQLKVKGQMWDCLPADVTKIMSGSALGVLSSHGRRGLAKHLTDLSLADARADGCQGTVEMCTSHKAQCLFAKLGYEDIYSFNYADWRDDAGNVVFHPPDGTKAITLVFKRL